MFNKITGVFGLKLGGFNEEMSKTFTNLYEWECSKAEISREGMEQGLETVEAAASRWMRIGDGDGDGDADGGANEYHAGRGDEIRGTIQAVECGEHTRGGGIY